MTINETALVPYFDPGNEKEKQVVIVTIVTKTQNSLEDELFRLDAFCNDIFTGTNFPPGYTRTLDPRILEPVILKSETNNLQPEISDIILDNSDGALDTYALYTQKYDNDSKYYTVLGDVSVYLGPRDGNFFSDFTEVFKGRVSDVEYFQNRTRLRIKVIPTYLVEDKTIYNANYPIVFGFARNVPLVSVSSAENIFACGPFDDPELGCYHDIPRVYENGKELPRNRNNYTISGGGSGADIRLFFAGGAVTSFTFLDAGSGQGIGSGDIFVDENSAKFSTLPAYLNQSGNFNPSGYGPLRLEVTSAGAGGIVTYEVLHQGRGYIKGQTITLVDEATRTKEVTVLVDDIENGKLTGYYIADGGSGYTPGAVLTIQRNVSDADKYYNNPYPDFNDDDTPYTPPANSDASISLVTTNGGVIFALNVFDEGNNYDEDSWIPESCNLNDHVFNRRSTLTGKIALLTQTIPSATLTADVEGNAFHTLYQSKPKPNLRNVLKHLIVLCSTTSLRSKYFNAASSQFYDDLELIFAAPPPAGLFLSSDGFGNPIDPFEFNYFDIQFYYLWEPDSTKFGFVIPQGTEVTYKDVFTDILERCQLSLSFVRFDINNNPGFKPFGLKIQRSNVFTWTGEYPNIFGSKTVVPYPIDTNSIQEKLISKPYRKLLVNYGKNWGQTNLVNPSASTVKVKDTGNLVDVPTIDEFLQKTYLVQASVEYNASYYQIFETLDGSLSNLEESLLLDTYYADFDSSQPPYLAEDQWIYNPMYELTITSLPMKFNSVASVAQPLDFVKLPMVSSDSNTSFEGINPEAVYNIPLVGAQDPAATIGSTDTLGRVTQVDWNMTDNVYTMKFVYIAELVNDGGVAPYTYTLSTDNI